MKTITDASLIRTSTDTGANPTNQPIIKIPTGSEITLILPYTGNVYAENITSAGNLKKINLAQIVPKFKNENSTNGVDLTWNTNFYTTESRNNYSYTKVVPTGSLLKYKFVLNNITYYPSSLGFEYGDINFRAPTGQSFTVEANGSSINQSNFPSPFNSYQGTYKWLYPITTSMPITGLPIYLTTNK